MQPKKDKGMERFSVDFEVTNYRDLVAAESGTLEPSKVRRVRLKGVVDTGATHVVLPTKIVKQLGLPKTRKVRVRYADGRRTTRNIVSDVHIDVQGRDGTFQAVSEPNREDALIGAIVLEALDFLPDCTHQRLVPRDPDIITTEIE